jgi:subtilisin family serine protease
MIKLFTAFLFFLITPSITFSQNDNYVKGELLIQFNKEIDAAAFENDYSDINMQIIRKLSDRMNIWWFKYSPEGTNDSEVRFRVSRDPSVKVVQFNHYVTIRNSFNEFAEQFSTFPNDPMFGDQWGLHNTGQSGGTPDADIDAPEAWDISTGGVTALGDTIVVAIVDGGCQLNHPDLNYWYNWNEIPGNSIDDDGNGYVDDFRGWNAYNNSPNVPSDYHGTHVSGIAGANGNNNTGVAGENWDVKIMPIAGSSGVEATVVAAYAYVLELRAQYNETNGALGAFVVATNSSFGVDYGQPEDYPLWCAMYDSMGVQGILSCAATANLNINIDIVGDIPTACPSEWMIAVTNTTRFDVKNSGAAYGLTTIDLGAPGTSILSTVTGSGYSTLTGTSMATPMVAGAIALLFSAADSTRILQYKNDPPGGAIAFRDILFEGVDTIPSLVGITVTGGRLNVYNAAMLISEPLPVELASFSIISDGNTVILNWATSSEINNSGFEIERSQKQDVENQNKWERITFVPGYGTSTEIHNYSFIDQDLQPESYQYRLKQIDFDGTFKYSNVVEVEINSPIEFSLEQNYPNPFNPATKIAFRVSDFGLVTLKVYDILGNEIAILVNEEKEPGIYEVEFDASIFSSGLFFYKLQSGNFADIKKMILLK